MTQQQPAREQVKTVATEAPAQQFRLLAEAIPQIVWTANPDGWIDYFNQRCRDYTGMTSEDTQGLGWQLVLHPDDLRVCLDGWKEALRTGESYEIECRFKRAKDGSYRWQLNRALPLRNESGQIVKWFGTCTDIDDQKQAEELLRKAHVELERLAAYRTKELEQANLLLSEQIVERERIDEARLEQAKILASILDNMGDAVIVTDDQKNLLVFNPAAERMFGDGATFNKAETWSNETGLFLPDEVTRFPTDQLPLTRAIRGDQIDDLEMFVRHARAPKGIWARVSGRPLKDGQGGFIGAVIVCRDITERKQEEAFRAGQGRILEMIARAEPLEKVLTQLMLLIEAQADGMYCSVLLLAEDGKHVRHGAAPSLPVDYVKAVNGAPIGPKNGSCGTAMYLGKQVIVTDIFTDPLWEDYRDLAAASGLRACWSTPILSGNGNVLGSFAMYYRQPQTPSGSEAKLTEVATHIAGMAIEHQRAEEELRSSEERLSLLQAITMEVTVAPDLPAAFAVVLRHVCEKTGWVFGQAWIPRNDRTALECSSAWFNADDEALREFRLGSEHTRLPMGVGLPGRVWLVKKSAWVSDVTVDSNFPRVQLARESGLKSALALPILSGDEVIGVIEFFMRERRREDERLIKVITAVAAQLDLAIERKRAEEALRQSQAELAHVSRVTTMGELAASIAHEVNQPLGAIVGNADICLHWLSGERPDLGKLREALDDISHDGRRASAVISRIRGLVKKNVPHKSMLDLNELAIESQALMEHDAHRKEVALVKELADALPLVHGDRVQLQQVLLNLMMNGMDAMVDVERESRRLTLITTHDGKTALIAVRDSGVGIEPQDVDRVFKPFHTTKSGGMGMGLAISRSIVEAHGGRLWVERNVGRGMTFKLMLPAGTPV